jgi:uncharacterized membrane protein YeaQ/YmgE (transglycosylase-associated protein family)
MAVLNPLYRQPGAVAPSVMQPGTDTINPALLPNSPTQQTFTISLASGVVGAFVAKNLAGVWALATNANKELVAGVIISKSGNDCTVASLNQVVTFPAAHTYAADAWLWLGAGTVVTSEPATPVGGRKVLLGQVLSTTTIIANVVYVEES